MSKEHKFTVNDIGRVVKHVDTHDLGKVENIMVNFDEIFVAVEWIKAEPSVHNGKYLELVDENPKCPCEYCPYERHK